MKNIFILGLMVLVFFSCENNSNKEAKWQVLHWVVHQRRQSMLFMRQDTLPLKRDFIKLEELGKLKKSIVDMILSKKIENHEYKLDSLIIWVNPLAKHVFKGEFITLFNIFISDVKNGGEMNFVYSEKYGVMMQIYDSFNILTLEESVIYDDQMEIKNRIVFSELQAKLLKDTIIFPPVRVPSMPGKDY